MNKEDCKEIFEEYIGKRLKLVSDGKEMIVTLMGLKATFLEILPADSGKKKLVRCDTITEFEELEEDVQEQVEEASEQPQEVAEDEPKPETEVKSEVEQVVQSALEEAAVSIPEVQAETVQDIIQPEIVQLTQEKEVIPEPMEADLPVLIDWVEPKAVFETDELWEDYELRLFKGVNKVTLLLEQHNCSYTELSGEAFLQLFRDLRSCSELSNAMYISQNQQEKNSYALMLEKVRQYLLDKLQFEARELPIDSGKSEFNTWERLYNARRLSLLEDAPTIVYNTLKLLQNKLEASLEQGREEFLPVGFQRLMDQVSLEEYCAVQDLKDGKYIGSLENFLKNYFNAQEYLSQFSGKARQKANIAILKIYCDLVARKEITLNDPRMGDLYAFAGSLAKDLAESLPLEDDSHIEEIRGWYQNALTVERNAERISKLLFRYFSTLFIAPESLQEVFRKSSLNVKELLKANEKPQVVVIVDNSESLKGSQLVAIKEGINKLVEGLSQAKVKTEISLVETSKARKIISRKSPEAFLKLGYEIEANGKGHRLDLAYKEALKIVGEKTAFFIAFTNVTAKDWHADVEVFPSRYFGTSNNQWFYSVAIGKECDTSYLLRISKMVINLTDTGSLAMTIAHYDKGVANRGGVSQKTSAYDAIFRDIIKYDIEQKYHYDYSIRDIKLASAFSAEQLMRELCSLKAAMAPEDEDFLFKVICASRYKPMVMAWLLEELDQAQATDTALKKVLAEGWEKYHSTVKLGIQELRFYALAPALNYRRTFSLEKVEDDKLSFMTAGDLALWQELKKATVLVRNAFINNSVPSVEEEILYLDREAQNALNIYGKCLRATSLYARNYLSRIAYKWYEKLKHELERALYSSCPLVDCQLSKTAGSSGSVLHLNLTNAKNRLAAHEVVVKLPITEDLYFAKLFGNGKTSSVILPVASNSSSRKGLEAVLEYKYIEAVDNGVIKYRSETKYLWLPMPADKVLFEEIRNPYAAISSGDAVKSKDMVYGREKVINKIVQAINFDQPKTYILWGQKRTGKSTVLLQLQKALEQKNFEKQPILVAFDGITEIDVDSLSGHAEVMKAFRKFLLRGIEGTLKKDAAIKAAFLDNDYKLGKLMGADNINDRFEKFFTIYNELECKKPLILFIDEFTQAYIWIQKGKLESSFIKWWREFLRGNKLVAVIVGQDYMQKFIELDGNGFGTMEKVKINYLTQEDTFKLIKEPILRENSKIEFEEEALEEVYELTAGSAFFTVKFCDLLVNYLNRNKVALINQDAVLKVKESMIKGDNALTVDFFESLYNDEGNVGDEKHKEDSRKVCKLIADNCAQVTRALEEDELYTLAHEKYGLDRNRVEQLVNALTRRDVLEKDHNTYKIKVQLFHEWLFVKG